MNSNPISRVRFLSYEQRDSLGKLRSFKDAVIKSVNIIYMPIHNDTIYWGFFQWHPRFDDFFNAYLQSLSPTERLILGFYE